MYNLLTWLIITLLFMQTLSSPPFSILDKLQTSLTHLPQPLSHKCNPGSLRCFDRLPIPINSLPNPDSGDIPPKNLPPLPFIFPAHSSVAPLISPPPSGSIHIPLVLDSGNSSPLHPPNVPPKFHAQPVAPSDSNSDNQITNFEQILTENLNSLPPKFNARPSKAFSSLHQPSPLYISPLLHSGQYHLAQRLALVSHLVPGVSHAGYSAFITIDAKAGTHLHFWFIPKQNCEHWEQEPLILWLQGGVGLSTLRGALQENLIPFNVTEDGRVGKFDFGLTQYMNVLMVDNAGVGFSHTQDPDYIVTDYDFIAEELYAVLDQIFLLFPEMKRAVFIGGISAGVSKVTATAELILSRDRQVVRLEGVIIGDGLTEWDTDFLLQAEYLHTLGMIEKRVVSNVSYLLDGIHAIAMSGARAPARKILFAQYLNELNGPIGYKDAELQDVMQAFRFRDHWIGFIEQDDVKDKLHVGRLPFVLIDPKAAAFLSQERGKTNGERLEIILNRKIPVFRYQGQYDGFLTYQSTVLSLRNLNWYGQECLQTKQFRRAQVWIDGILFGYKRKCHNLWEVLALSAAHVVQMNKAKPLGTVIWDFIRESQSLWPQET